MVGQQGDGLQTRVGTWKIPASAGLAIINHIGLINLSKLLENLTEKYADPFNAQPNPSST
jgi:hypothetical protein